MHACVVSSPHAAALAPVSTQLYDHGPLHASVGVNGGCSASALHAGWIQSAASGWAIVAASSSSSSCDEQPPSNKATLQLASITLAISEPARVTDGKSNGVRWFMDIGRSPEQATRHGHQQLKIMN
jgi:hypothetical protein